MRVADFCTRRAVSLHAQVSTAEAVRKVSMHGFREYPVIDGGDRLLGILSDEELLTRGHAPLTRPARGSGVRSGRARAFGTDPECDKRRLVGELVRRRAVTIGPHESCALASWRMIETGAMALCVASEAVLTGIVTFTNLLQAYCLYVRERGEEGSEPAVGRCAVELGGFPAPGDRWSVVRESFRELGVRSLPVVSGRRVVGSVTQRRFLELELGRSSEAAEPTVAEAMTSTRGAMPAAAPLIEAARALLATKLDALPVVGARNRLVGVVTPAAVVRRCATADLTYGRFPG